MFNLPKQHQQYISARNADHGDPENNPESDAADIARRAKPEEEGAQLLIQPDSPRNPYTPLQFSNSLGKLQAATVKAPRKIIDVGILNSDTAETAAQKDSRFVAALVNSNYLVPLKLDDKIFNQKTGLYNDKCLLLSWGVAINN